MAMKSESRAKMKFSGIGQGFTGLSVTGLIIVFNLFKQKKESKRFSRLA